MLLYPRTHTTCSVSQTQPTHNTPFRYSLVCLVRIQLSCKITDLENIEPEIIFLNQVVVYYFYLNLEYIEQFFNRSVISQADDREDAFRWVEAINAAQLSKAPQSSKLADSIALHTAKVNIIEILTFSLISN